MSAVIVVNLLPHLKPLGSESHHMVGCEVVRVFLYSSRETNCYKLPSKDWVLCNEEWWYDTEYDWELQMKILPRPYFTRERGGIPLYKTHIVETLKTS